MSRLPEDQCDVAADPLREDVELLAMNAVRKAAFTDLKQIVERLGHLVAELNHIGHGRKSDKLGEDDRPLVVEDLETAAAEDEKRQYSPTSSDNARQTILAQAKPRHSAR